MRIFKPPIGQGRGQGQYIGVIEIRKHGRDIRALIRKRYGECGRDVSGRRVVIKFYFFRYLGNCGFNIQEIFGTSPKMTLTLSFLFFVVLGLVPRTSWISDWYREPTPQYKIDRYGRSSGHEAPAIDPVNQVRLSVEWPAISFLNI